MSLLRVLAFSAVLAGPFVLAAPALTTKLLVLPGYIAHLFTLPGFPVDKIAKTILT